MDGKVCKKTSSSNQCSNGIIFMPCGAFEDYIYLVYNGFYFHQLSLRKSNSIQNFQY